MKTTLVVALIVVIAACVQGSDLVACRNSCASSFGTMKFINCMTKCEAKTLTDDKLAKTLHKVVTELYGPREFKKLTNKVLSDSTGPVCDRCRASCDSIPAGYTSLKEQCLKACETACTMNLSDNKKIKLSDSNGPVCDRCRSSCDNILAGYPELKAQCLKACETACNMNLSDNQQVLSDSTGPVCDRCKASCDNIPAGYPELKAQCLKACETACNMNLSDSEIPCSHCKVFSGASYDKCQSSCVRSSSDSKGPVCDRCRASCDTIPAGYPELKAQCLKACETACNMNLSDNSDLCAHCTFLNGLKSKSVCRVKCAVALSDSTGPICDRCRASCDNIPAGYPELKAQCLKACETACNMNLSDSEIPCSHCKVFSGASYDKCKATCN